MVCPVGRENGWMPTVVLPGGDDSRSPDMPVIDCYIRIDNSGPEPVINNCQVLANSVRVMIAYDIFRRAAVIIDAANRAVGQQRSKNRMSDHLAGTSNTGRSPPSTPHSGAGYAAMGEGARCQSHSML